MLRLPRSGLLGSRRTAAAVLPPVGAFLMMLSYHHAAGLAAPDQLQFTLYWAGFLIGMVPLVALACGAGVDGIARMCALVGIGLFGTVPRLLRTPFGPQGSDEFIHLRQTLETFLNGDVGHNSPLLQIAKEFPGLHQAVSAFAHLTGLPLWHAGTTVVAAAHVLSVLAAYQLVRAVGGGPSGAAVGAVIYTLNPSWVYFDTIVSYESLAVPILLWFLATAVTAARAPAGADLRALGAATLCALALPVIHHLTTLFGMLIMATLVLGTGVAKIRRGRRRTPAATAPAERWWPLALTWALLSGSIVLWWSGKYEWLVNYLSPALTRGWTQLQAVLSAAGRDPSEPTGERTLFGGSLIPIYEKISGFLFPPLLLLLCTASAVVLWRNRSRIGAAPWAFTAVAAGYFASIPMVFTKGGAEGAHRSWAFSFIGVAVLCGLAWSLGPGSGRALRWRWLTAVVDRATTPFLRPRLRVPAAGAALIILTFGGAALGTNVADRFPGPMVVGEDSRALSREGEAVTAWVVAQSPPETPVLADRWVSQMLGSTGRMSPLKPSTPFPIWDIYIKATPVSESVLRQILHADVRYFVVDSRMATTRPKIGYWFTKDEPGVDGDAVFPRAAIDRFNCLPWLRARFAAGTLTVYQVDADLLRRSMAGSCEGAHT